jgi:hypothetical protein
MSTENNLKNDHGITFILPPPNLSWIPLFASESLSAVGATKNDRSASHFAIETKGHRDEENGPCFSEASSRCS